MPDNLFIPRRSVLMAAVGATVTVAGCAWFGPRRDRPASIAPVDHAARSESFAGLVEAHNAARARAGRTSLVVSPALNTAAQAHAEDMAARRRMSHRGSDGSSPFRRIERAGYRFLRAGENIAAGQRTLEDLMADWLRSPGHRRNILGNFAEIGTGHAIDRSGTPYWCVTFGTPGLA